MSAENVKKSIVVKTNKSKFSDEHSSMNTSESVTNPLKRKGVSSNIGKLDFPNKIKHKNLKRKSSLDKKSSVERKKCTSHKIKLNRKTTK